MPHNNVAFPEERIPFIRFARKTSRYVVANNEANWFKADTLWKKADISIINYRPGVAKHFAAIRTQNDSI